MKYKFWMEINGEYVEWISLTKRTAMMMYNATRENTRYQGKLNFGWEEQP